MSRAIVAVGVVCAALLVLLGWRLDGERQRADGLDRQLAAQRVETARAQARADSLAARYRVDTVRLRVALTRYDTVSHTDTLTRVDTVTGERIVYVPRAVADTAIHACTLALRTCEQRVAAVEAVTASVRAELGTVAAQRDAAITRGRWERLAWGVGGLVLGRLMR